MNVAIPKTRMTVTEFFAWVETQTGGRYELVEGEVVMMSPERVRHNLVKGSAYRALVEAVRAAGLPCTVFTDGVSVVIDEYTSREPDVSVQCGIAADMNATTIDAPVIVIEVASPSSERSDTGVKLAEYFSVPSIRHYLIVMPQKRLLLHHERNAAGEIATRIVHGGEITLDPPGMNVDVLATLGPADPADVEAR